MIPKELRPLENSSEDRDEMLKALLDVNCDANRATVRRTRYAVRDKAIVLKEQRLQRRHSLGLALFVLSTMFILLAPAIWNGAQDLLDGEHLGDLSTQLAFLLILVASTMFAALAAFWMRRHGLRGDT
jgi:hypothetical protein